MNKPTPSLNERRMDMTRNLILDAAFVLLSEGRVAELTVRAVAQQAAISERTVFRYFPSRDALLDSVADYLLTNMAIPAMTDTADGLREAPALLYRAFEEKAAFTRAALHPDLVGRVRTLQGESRWTAVTAMLAAIAPQRGEAQRRIAAANICYHLTASSWNYYRHTFGFDLDECIACAETAVRQALDGFAAAEGGAPDK